MLRKEVLKLYRDILRTISKVPDENNRQQLKEWARSDFQTNKSNSMEEIQIKMLLNYGRRSLKELQTSLELSGIKT